VHSQSKRYRDASGLSRFTPLTLIDKQPRIGHGVAFVEAPPLPRCSYPFPHVLDRETVLQIQYPTIKYPDGMAITYIPSTHPHTTLHQARYEEHNKCASPNLRHTDRPCSM
jgi:hypothetical protein